MSIAVLVALNAEILSRFSSLAKLGAANAKTRADARMLFAKTVGLANLISDEFLLLTVLETTKTPAKLSLILLKSDQRKLCCNAVGASNIGWPKIVLQVNYFHLASRVLDRSVNQHSRKVFQAWITAKRTKNPPSSGLNAASSLPEHYSMFSGSRHPMGFHRPSLRQ